MARFQDVKESFKQRLLTTVRKDMFGHFERTISEYEKEIDRKRKLLDMVTKNSDPAWQPGTGDKASDPSEPDTDDSDFWKDTRTRTRKSQCPSVLDSLTHNEIAEGDMGLGSVENRFSCSDVKASGSLEPESDDSVDSDFWKESRKPQVNLKNNDISEKGMRCYTKNPYSCPDCGKRFRYMCQMKTHRECHAEVTPFVCPVCDQKFSYDSHLKMHVRTHTGEKPFSCPVCGKKYAHKTSMRNHMATKCFMSLCLQYEDIFIIIIIK
uniref:C2H2-type domain-containing protein n=1 Tax=Seriola dumerili TaxID=41447 RepID=A0A3B4T4Q5_SERDU